MYAAAAAAPMNTDGHADAGRRRPVSRRRGKPESILAPLLVFAVTASVLIAVAAAPTAADRYPELGSRRVRVSASDTLWSIARANPVDGLTTAQAVAAIRRLNRLDTGLPLQPGAVIAVPCAEAGISNLAMR